MKRIVFWILFSASLLGAKTLNATYEVSYGVFQTMGISDARFETHEDNTYFIRIEARTTGLAKILSNNRIEIYESRGKIKDGRLIPDQFKKTRKSDSKSTTKIFTFDHLAKTVWKETIEEGKSRRSRNDFYAPEDILSLFFNVRQYMQSRQDQQLYALGARKKDGRIDVVFPRGDALAAMKKELEMEDGIFLKVILNDRIFSSANGELLINLGKDGLCEKAVLQDVLLFGDIVGKRVR